MSKAKIANQYADLIINEKFSLRQVAKAYGVSKSTVHNYVRKYTTGMLRRLRLRSQLEKNSENFWIKGGIATSLKWHKLKGIK